MRELAHIKIVFQIKENYRNRRKAGGRKYKVKGRKYIFLHSVTKQLFAAFMHIPFYQEYLEIQCKFCSLYDFFLRSSRIKLTKELLIVHYLSWFSNYFNYFYPLDKNKLVCHI